MPCWMTMRFHVSMSIAVLSCLPTRSSSMTECGIPGLTSTSMSFALILDNDNSFIHSSIHPLFIYLFIYYFTMHGYLWVKVYSLFLCNELDSRRCMLSGRRMERHLTLWITPLKHPYEWVRMNDIMYRLGQFMDQLSRDLTPMIREKEDVWVIWMKNRWTIIKSRWSLRKALILFIEVVCSQEKICTSYQVMITNNSWSFLDGISLIPE